VIFTEKITLLNGWFPTVVYLEARSNAAQERCRRMCSPWLGAQDQSKLEVMAQVPIWPQNATAPLSSM